MLDNFFQRYLKAIREKDTQTLINTFLINAFDDAGEMGFEEINQGVTKLSRNKIFLLKDYHPYKAVVTREDRNPLDTGPIREIHFYAYYFASLPDDFTKKVLIEILIAADLPREAALIGMVNILDKKGKFSPCLETNECEIFFDDNQLRKTTDELIETKRHRTFSKY